MPEALSPEVAVQIMREAGYTPLAPYPGSGTGWPCRCDRCGRARRPRLDNVRQGKRCPCVPVPEVAGPAGGKRSPEEIMRDAGYTPLAPYPGAGRPWPARCDFCGEERAPRLDNVKQGKRCRCRSASDRRSAAPDWSRYRVAPAAGGDVLTVECRDHGVVFTEGEGGVPVTGALNVLMFLAQRHEGEQHGA